jgi:hypothetical protein
MTWFFYVIKSKEHEVKKGYIEAESEDQLREKFKKEGYLIYSIGESEKPESEKKWDESFGFIRQNKTAIIILVIIVLAVAFDLKRRGRIAEEKAVLKSKEPVSKTEPPDQGAKQPLAKPEGSGIEDIYVEEESQPMKGDVVIRLKGTTEEVTPSGRPGESYFKAKDYYAQANRRFTRDLPSREFYQTAARYARFALMSATNNSTAEEMRLIIRDCQERIKTAK